MEGQSSNGTSEAVRPARPKFYVCLVERREFVVSARDEHEAILKFWQSLGRKVTGDETIAELSSLPIFEGYLVHRGRRSLAKLVPSGKAYWRATRAVRTLAALVMESRAPGAVGRMHTDEPPTPLDATDWA